jgi:hypothetical protein
MNQRCALAKAAWSDICAILLVSGANRASTVGGLEEAGKGKIPIL